jgi:peptidyl-tRNA hydrolase, PTH2 family
MHKQVIVVRTDLDMSPGKIAAQAAHASNGACNRAARKSLEQWEKEGSKKVVVGIDSLKKLQELEFKAKELGLVTYMVKDAGLTQVQSGTTTALGIGPGPEEKIDKVTGSLPLL